MTDKSWGRVRPCRGRGRKRGKGGAFLVARHGEASELGGVVWVGGTNES